MVFPVYMFMKESQHNWVVYIKIQKKYGLWNNPNTNWVVSVKIPLFKHGLWKNPLDQWVVFLILYILYPKQ